VCCLSSKGSVRSGTLRWLYNLQRGGKESEIATKTADNTYATGPDSDYACKS
jgi:hypothetical protein